MRQTLNIINSERTPRSQTEWTARACLQKALLGMCLFFIGHGTTFAAPSLAASPSTLSLSMHNQQFSAHIIGAPLEKVLTTLTSYGPLRFIIKGNVKNDLISSSFRDLSLKESLETLLLGYDYAIIQRQLDPTPQTSEFRYLMEVVILSTNSVEPSPYKNKPTFISYPRISTQSALLQATPILEKSDQTKPLRLVTENDARDIQVTLEEALGDTHPETRSLIKELLRE